MINPLSDLHAVSKIYSFSIKEPTAFEAQELVSLLNAGQGL